MVTGNGTKDLAGPDGLSTENFIAFVEENLKTAWSNPTISTKTIVKPSRKLRRNYNVDENVVKDLFSK